jgi:glycerol-3-phosphate dehydrogenase (NAD(P)+)
MNDNHFPPAPRTAVVGCGSWGTALATLLYPASSQITLIGRNKDVIEDINTRHRNERYLPGELLDPGIKASSDLDVTRDADLILLVLPSAAIRSTAEQLASLQIGPEVILTSCSKGIERGTGKRMSEVISEILPDQPLAALSGPNHAEEVCKGLATMTVIGSANSNVSGYLQGLLTSPSFRCYTSDDLTGLEWGGAMKNIFAIASGIATGLGLGDNATAGLVTRGLAEMIRLGTALGGKPDTFTGLSGVGDLIATCYSHHSRNFRAGISIGKGNTVEATLKEAGMVVEGIPNCQSIYEVAKRSKVRTPLIDSIYSVLYENQPAAEALRELLTRAPRPELES